VWPTKTLICQTCWSNALLQPGVDPRMALAALLRVAPKDIEVREGARSEPLAKASTVPRPRPNNPSPNTEVAPEPNNGVPGFPSGDS
jgi:hypothetical protein